jgi:uncharacterized protein YmfQ (DUF2313 family)
LRRERQKEIDDKERERGGEMADYDERLIERKGGRRRG